MARPDGRVGRCRVDRPGVGVGAGVGIAGRIDRAHLERMGAVGDPRIALRVRARREAGTVEVALERGAGLRGGEGEAGARRVRERRRVRRDRRVGRDRVDRPAVARDRAGVAGKIRRRLHVEGVGAVCERAVRIRARASSVGAAVDLALETGHRLVGAERDRPARRIGVR